MGLSLDDLDKRLKARKADQNKVQPEVKPTPEIPKGTDQIIVVQDRQVRESPRQISIAEALSYKPPTMNTNVTTVIEEPTGSQSPNVLPPTSINKGRCKVVKHYKAGTKCLDSVEIDSVDGKPLRVLMITDTHFRDKDFKTIGGYVKATNAVLDQIEEIIIREKIDIAIHGGDVVDSGFSQQSMVHHFMNRLNRIKQLLHGMFFVVVGNHLFLEIDNNPEVYWIQPSDIIKPREPIFAEEPLLLAPYAVRINGTQYDLMHYSKDRSSYFRNIINPEKTQYRHACYHDEVAVPGSVRLEENIRVEVRSELYDALLSPYDSVTCAHIHTPHDQIVVTTPSGKKVPMDIPGSLGIVTSEERQKHSKVFLPIHEVGTNTFNKTYVQVKTHVEKYLFYNKQQKKIAALIEEEQMPELKKYEKAVGEEAAATTMFAIKHGVEEYLHMRGFSAQAVEVCRLACEGTLDFNSLCKYITEEYKERQRNLGGVASIGVDEAAEGLSILGGLE